MEGSTRLCFSKTSSHDHFKSTEFIKLTVRFTDLLSFRGVLSRVCDLRTQGSAVDFVW